MPADTLRRLKTPHARRFAGFALKVLPAAIAIAFSQAAIAANINVGGNSMQLPVNGVPTAGSNAGVNSVSGSVTGTTMTVNVTGRATVDWSSFNIAPTYTVNFNGSGAAILNRVADTGGRSSISGILTGSNMLVMLMNPNGITFQPGSSVNVGALVATTGTINEFDFMTSALGTHTINISGAGGSIENRGQIIAAGLAALVAPSVLNYGTIAAGTGKVLLAGRDTATITMNGGLYEFALPGSGAGSITNEVGASLTGKTIHLSTGDAFNVLTNTINLKGIQQATDEIVVKGGTVELKTALQVTSVSGTISGNSEIVNVQSGGGRIQDGVNIVRSGGTVNVAAGTYAQNVTITKALTLDGAGKGVTIIDPVSGDGIVVSGNIGLDKTVAITDLTVQGGNIGIKVADNANLGTITLDRVAVRDNASHGFISSNGASNSNSTVANINILNSVFAGNGVGAGTADINLFLFNGNALISNVDILGTRSATPSSLVNATDYGLQIRGFGTVASMAAAGHVTLNNVRIAGNYRRAHLGIQRYSDASNISMSGVVLGGASSASTGNGTVAVTVSNAGFGTFFSSDMHGAVSLGNTSFSALANANPDISIGTETAGLRVDATQTEFSGITRTHTAAGAENFSIENRVSHAMDDTAIPAGRGVVIWQQGNLYVPLGRSITSGLTAAGATDIVNVAPGTFAENLILDQKGNLQFHGSTIQGLTINAGAAGSGVGGNVMANGATGFQFHAPVVLLSDTSLSTGGVAIGLGAIASGGNALMLNAGAGGAITGTSFTGNGNLTIANSNGTTFSGPVAAGVVTISDTSAGQTVAFLDNLSTTGAFNATGTSNAYNVSMTGSTNSIGGAGTFGNTGSLTLGNGVDTTTFMGGVTATAPSGTTVDGTLRTAGQAMSFGPMTLGGSSTLDTTNNGGSAGGANIALNGDIQNAPGGPYSLTLTAGSGNINLISGGSSGNPLGKLVTSSNNFTLTGTLWVSGYDIDALGVVALSDHTLRQVGSGGTNTIDAGDDVIGNSINQSAVQIQSGGDVIGNTISQGAVQIQSDGNVIGSATSGSAVQIQSGGNIVALVNAPTALVDAAGDVQIVLQTDSAVIHALRNAEVSGFSTSVTLDAPAGNVSGNFGQVSNVGTGLINVNGKPEGSSTLTENANVNRVIPSESTVSRRTSSAVVAGGAAADSVSMLTPDQAGEMLDQGQPVELDLTPGNQRRR